MRPARNPAWQLSTRELADGLVILGAGPWGCTDERKLPVLDEEIKLVQRYLDNSLPVVGIGVGAQVLALAAGGAVQPAPLEFSIGNATATTTNALQGYLPASYPLVIYMRDFPQPPPEAQILAVDEQGRPALFQYRNCLGFTGHPGIKAGIVEDLVMEFVETPSDAETLNGLTRLRESQADVTQALGDIMVGLVKTTGWMQD